MSRPTTRWCGSVRRRPHAVVQGRSLSRSEGHGDSFAVLEQRIAALTSTLESREQPVAGENSEQLESALRALSDRLDRMPVGNDSASAFAHLEQRVSYLLERLEASSDPPRRQSRAGRGRAAGDSAPSRNPACELCRAGRNRDRPRASRAGQRSGRHRQARIVRHPFQPVGNRPPHPGFAGSRSQHARPCGRPSGDDRRRSAQRPRAPRPRLSPPRAAGRRAARRDAAAAEARNAESRCGTSGHFAAAPRDFHAVETPAPTRRDAAPASLPTSDSAKFWSRMPRRRARRSRRSCRPITRSSRERGRPDGRLRRRSASRRPKTPSAKFRQARANVHYLHLELHCRRPPRRPGRRGRTAGRQERAGTPLKAPPAPRRHRRSPPRFARCWSARAWS